MTDTQAPPQGWSDRIVGHGMLAPDQYLASPYNFRIHSFEQERALEEVLDRVGWVRRVLVNRTTGHVIDGHLRVALAIRRGEPEIPYDEVELTLADEKLVLAALDPIAGMAGTDHEKLRELMADFQVEAEGAFKGMLDALATMPQPEAPKPPPTQTGALADRFLVPPFSVLNAREGWWQDRKRAWIALGIQSELGRGHGQGMNTHTPTITQRRPNATPGGATMPATDYSRSGARGDGRGRAIGGEA